MSNVNTSNSLSFNYLLNEGAQDLYIHSHFQISLGVAFFPYIKIPTWKTLPASFINSQTLTIKIPLPMAISIHGHVSSMVRRMIKMAGEVNGMYEPIWAISPLGFEIIGPINIIGKNGSIRTIPWKFPEEETSSIVAPRPTNKEANNKYPSTAIASKMINSGTNKYSKMEISNFHITKGIAKAIQTN